MKQLRIAKMRETKKLEKAQKRLLAFRGAPMGRFHRRIMRLPMIRCARFFRTCSACSPVRTVMTLLAVAATVVSAMPVCSTLSLPPASR